MSDDPNEARADRIRAARTRLVAVLSGIAEDAKTGSSQRCPYRTRDDECTFTGGCRNQVRRRPGPHGCAGGTLNAEPAAQDAVRVAIRKVERS